MKRVALLLCLSGLAGCSTDSANALSRDYRNLNNEAIDALMMTTSEARAKLARDKILKPYQERLRKIDKRMDDWLRQTDDKEVIFDTLDSMSVATLMAETPINRMRLQNEQKRLAQKCVSHANEIAEAMQPGGSANPAVMAQAREQAKKEWPALHELAQGTGYTELKTQLNNNKFQALIPDFKKGKKWANQKPPNFDDLWVQLENRIKALDR